MRSNQTLVSSVSLRNGLVGCATRRSAVVVLATLSLLALASAWNPATVSAQFVPPPIGGQHPDPELTEFVASNVAINTWLVQGRVTGCAQLGGMVVRFGGLADGQQTTTGSDGTFLLILTVPTIFAGNVTAEATCRDGHTSNTAVYYFSSY